MQGRGAAPNSSHKNPLATTAWMQGGPDFATGPSGTGEGELGADEHFPTSSLGHNPSGRQVG